ncbi:MAG: hypothetical protein QOJ82_1995 [Solirubrobacteraceae bacterium]|nr:hypothetical protein [Solirubrobacteraceae bacterium]
MSGVFADLSGRVAIVTGAGAGIGRATALHLAGQGMDVVIAERNGDSARSTADEISRSGGRSLAVEVDVSDDAAVSALVAQSLDRLGRIDCLVNNAGIELFKSIDDTTVEEWDRVLAVNLRGMYSLCRHALPALREAPAASVVNISSNHAIATLPNIGAYAASKGAIVSLTRNMALEFGPDGIRVNCVTPGWIRTAKLDSFLAEQEHPDEALAHYISLHAVGRMGEPEDIARVCAFLLSEDAAFMTGSTVVADGGMTSRLF